MGPRLIAARRRGAALVEFALLLPVLMLVLLGVIEFALIGHHKLLIVQGSRAGVREAAIGRTVAVVKTRVKNAAPGMGITDDQIAVEYNTRADGTGTWVPVQDNATGTANTVPYAHPIRVRVSNWPHRLVSGSFFGWLPGVQNQTLPLSGQMIMRRE